MKKVLILGTSHVGALKMGFEKIKSNYLENFSIRFAAVPTADFVKIFLKNNELCIPKDIQELYSGLYKNLEFPIDIRNFDFIVLVSFKSPLLLVNSQNYYSKSLLKKVINELLFFSEIKNQHLFLKLNEIIQSKLILIPHPVPIKKRIKNELFEKTYSNYKSNQISLIRLICDEFWEKEKKVSILLPPENLLEKNQLNTKEKYVRGGLSWDGFEKDGAISHMNEEYGREIMLSLLNKLNKKN